jgi:hypothetical protein
MVSMLAAWFPSATSAQTAPPPAGVASFELMAEYLSRGTGRWRAPVPARDDGPDALGLWFERTAGGRLLELTVVLDYGAEARPGLRGYWLWHPGRKEILYHEVSPSGRVRMGTAHFTDTQTFVTLTDAVGSNGRTTPNRGVNILSRENEHDTTAHALNAQGEWVEQQTLTWAREPGPAGR